MRNIVIISCDDTYVPKSIVALQLFTKYNPDYKKIIIGTFFKDETKYLCEGHDIELVEIDLSSDFYNLHKRPYGQQYPIECFYHLYAYKLFMDYDFIIKIESDIYTNKKIDINFNLIKYIGGSYKNDVTIKTFNPIMNDYENIKNKYGIGDINQCRMYGGVNVYNIKNLVDINFYEKILDYYQTSLKINSPRCGDDSLMVMYQLLNPSHIHLLEPQFHILCNNVMNNINYDDITFFHFVGSSQKYWEVSNINKLTNIQRFFYDNMIEYIYNNFTLEFIKKYIPEIFLNISNVIIPFYYYNRIDNFGDIITPYLLNNFCKKDNFTFNFCNTGSKIISCGSIMRLCNKNTIVYGSGIRDINQNINKGIIKSVRGPLTRNRLLKIGCYCPPIYGDPGLLLPLYYNPVIKKIYKLGIIPHHIHYNTVSELYSSTEGIKVINLITKNIEEVIDDILSCDKIISSSLHGLIVSDAYNIPNKWVKFTNQINGDYTKYYDYFLSVKRVDINFIDCLHYKKLPENIHDIINDVNINYDINYIQEKFFMDKDGIKNYTKFLYKSLTIDMYGNDVLKKNEWLALKEHWKLSDNILISLLECYLKKNQLHSSELDDNLKIKVSVNKEVLYIKNFNKNYYIVSF